MGFNVFGRKAEEFSGKPFVRPDTTADSHQTLTGNLRPRDWD